MERDDGEVSFQKKASHFHLNTKTIICSWLKVVKSHFHREISYRQAGAWNTFQSECLRLMTMDFYDQPGSEYNSRTACSLSAVCPVRWVATRHERSERNGLQTT